MKNFNSICQSFLQLVRLGIGTGTINDSQLVVCVSEDWATLKALADAQGLSAVVLDGLNEIRSKHFDRLGNQNDVRDERSPSQVFVLQWIGEVMKNYEARHAKYEKAISSLAGFYNQYGYKMMVLKGYACALNWPRPEHRPCGDIDIWQFGKQKDADRELVKKKGLKIDNSHHHHTVFEWQGFSVENHYDFINVHHHPSNVAFEKLLKEQGQNDSYHVEVNGEKVYLPAPNLHALFLLKHAFIEFAATGLNLRQLLDWAFFVKTHVEEVDWTWLEGILAEFGMKRLYDVFNAICVSDLGFGVSTFPNVQFDTNLKDRVLSEILNPETPNNKPKYLLSRVAWKWHRWKANEWKHDLCYKESMWSAFWSGVWGHLLKPGSI